MQWLSDDGRLRQRNRHCDLRQRNRLRRKSRCSIRPNCGYRPSCLTMNCCVWCSSLKMTGCCCPQSQCYGVECLEHTLCPLSTSCCWTLACGSYCSHCPHWRDSCCLRCWCCSRCLCYCMSTRLRDVRSRWWFLLRRCWCCLGYCYS